MSKPSPDEYWKDVVVRGLDDMGPHELRSFAEGLLQRVRFHYADPAEQVAQVVALAEDHGVNPIADLEANELADTDTDDEEAVDLD